jgi:hypothetical protein
MFFARRSDDWRGVEPGARLRPRARQAGRDLRADIGKFVANIRAA